MQKSDLSLFDGLISIVNKDEDNIKSQTLTEKEIRNYKKYTDLKKALIYVKKHKKDVSDNNQKNIILLGMITFLSFILTGVVSYSLGVDISNIINLLSITSLCFIVMGLLAFRRYKKIKQSPSIEDYLPNEYKYLLDENFFNIAAYYHYIYEDSKEINNNILNECARVWTWANMDFNEMCNRIIEKEEDDFLKFSKSLSSNFNIQY